MDEMRDKYQPGKPSEEVIKAEVKKTQSEAVSLMDEMERAVDERGEFFIKFGDRNDRDSEGNPVDSRVLLLAKGMNLITLTGNDRYLMKVALTRNGPRIMVGRTDYGHMPGDMPTYDFQKSRFATQVSRDGRGRDYLMYGFQAGSYERLYSLEECLEEDSILASYKRPFWEGPDLERPVTMDQLKEAVNGIIKDNLTTPTPKPSRNAVIRSTIKGEQDGRAVMGGLSGILKSPPSSK